MPDPQSEDILWLTPDPRAIIPLAHFHVSRSLLRTLKRGHFHATFDQSFMEVVEGCSQRPDTWITDEFKEAYGELHREGDAHSVEIWQSSELVGGVYGVALQGAFFAESMFHRATDASKIALLYLVERLKACRMELLEVQFLTPHLASLGAIEISRKEYLRRLKHALESHAKFTRAL
jgi:leucyl/phenylalanyl-tRNA--protein transferase